MQKHLPMMDFVLARLEEAKYYNILHVDKTHILVQERNDLLENPATAYLFLHQWQRPIHEVLNQLARNTLNNTYTGHVFLKDGEHFMVRLAERGHYKRDRSLKHFGKSARDAMIHLRGIEKAVKMKFRTFCYYQPKTEQLPESLRFYFAGPVLLSYSHLGEGMDGYGFAQPRVARDFALMEEITLPSAKGFSFTKISNGAAYVALDMSQKQPRATLCSRNLPLEARLQK